MNKKHKNFEKCSKTYSHWKYFFLVLNLKKSWILKKLFKLTRDWDSKYFMLKLGLRRIAYCYCLKDVFCTLWIGQKMSFVRYECLKDVICTLWMFQICLFCVMNVSKMSYVRYKSLKDVFCTLWISWRCLLYVMNVLKISFVRYECLKDVFCTLCMSKRWISHVKNVSKETCLG